MYTADIVTDSLGFLLQSSSPAIASGKLIFNASVSGAFDAYDNHGGRDYFGEAVSNSNAPNRGADNSDALTGIFNAMYPSDVLKVYPNPVTKGQKLKVDIPGEERYYSCEIVDLNGRIHYNRNGWEGNTIEIDTNDMQSGLYVLKISSGEKVCSSPFIIN